MTELTEQQLAREDRRARLGVILSRVERDVALPAERAMLRPLVEAELTEADHAHRTAGGMQRANRRMREQLAEAQLDPARQA